jgi:hypothetical protein
MLSNRDESGALDRKSLAHLYFAAIQGRGIREIRGHLIDYFTLKISGAVPKIHVE